MLEKAKEIYFAEWGRGPILYRPRLNAIKRMLESEYEQNDFENINEFSELDNSIDTSDDELEEEEAVQI